MMRFTTLTISIFLGLAAILLTSSCTLAFAPPTPVVPKTSIPSWSVSLQARKKEDLSDIETRDMTREEMLQLNRENEEVMNRELSLMTGFSLVISLPILYLCWVAFFSD